MKILIFGATGGTGRELVKQASALGHEVTALVRDPSKLEDASESCRVLKGSVTDRALRKTPPSALLGRERRGGEARSSPWAYTISSRHWRTYA